MLLCCINVLMSATEDYLLTMKLLLLLFIILSLKVSKNTEILWDYMCEQVFISILDLNCLHFISVISLSAVTMSLAEIIQTGLNHYSPQ